MKPTTIPLPRLPRRVRPSFKQQGFSPHHFSGHYESNIAHILLIHRDIPLNKSQDNMTSWMVLLCVIPVLLAMLSPSLVEAIWEGWNTGEGGVKWLFNCDFPGYDIGKQPSAGEA
ncbi:hypothetical protein OUZ56_030576 [Daphnia magna]|uniref:Uncharacterized protein n=1 Tax=Daphnia magna TaxID=35525 RepID=A0ABQ9ZRQ3_9CRUS|nr:hypothetical protein OUZ56_030576 [Daphnia magna]